MLSKKEIKDIQSLSHKKFRDELKLFVAEGPKIVHELLQLVPEHIEKIYAVKGWEQQSEAFVLFEEITEIELGRITQLQTPNQVLAVLRQWEEAPLAPSGSKFILYLDAIQDPGNMGTIIRIADWFGISHIVCGPGCADSFHPKVVQSTMASIARVTIENDAGDWLKQQTIPIFAAMLEGKNVYELEKTEAGILLIGNESKGLRSSLLDEKVTRITIPRSGKAESLNAAVATGIILSHLLPS
jgi:TrmH family RNA methyltransferase